ncbi:AraC family transcriptional regulator [Microcoleus sp. CAWBG640]|uniref:helix-turn-helix transcriptional regulator n=1 Tax=Microcoleus sp. CAWBG640 TaxID=2841653 RepID=UPI00312B83E9
MPIFKHSLRAERTVYAPPGERISDLGIPDHCISLHIANPGNLERRLERRLDGGKLIERLTLPGFFTFVPAFRQPEWFWESAVEILDIYLPATVLEQIAMQSCVSAPQTIELIDRFAIRDPLLEQLALTLSAEVERGDNRDRLYFESVQTLLAVHLLRHHCTVKITNYPKLGKLSPSKLQQIIDYIQDDLDRDIGLADLAEVVQMSSHHFGKIFKQSTGVSPHQYVLQCRIDRAKKLLSNPQLTLADISQTVGFCDQSHFTNVFRRYTSVTPRQYRDRL